MNSRGVGVGELIGDGVVLSFDSSEYVTEFTACLRLSESSESSEFSVFDFGYPDPNFQYIYPAGNAFHLLYLAFHLLLFGE